MEKPGLIAFLGFGEAAQAFCEGWERDPPAMLRAYDRKTDVAATAAAKRQDFRRFGVEGCESTHAAVTGAALVFSVVTADQALAAASAAATGLAPGAFYFDMNSVAPETKRAAAARIEAVGARYVDAAVMSPVRPALTRAPLLVSGPYASEGCAVLRTLGFAPRQVAGGVGAVSAIKMIRSIMVKGLEALTAECLLSAHAAGVEDEVLASLDASFPGWNWRERGDYNLGRMVVHGTRRAAEMREAAGTAAALAQRGTMAAATAEWQERLGALPLSSLPDGLAAKAAAILTATGRVS